MNIVDIPENWFSAMMHGGERNNSGAYLVMKRGMDICISASAILFLSPVFLLCMVIVKLECPSANVFFKQNRTGFLGQRFVMYKFRTMVPDAEKRKEELRKASNLGWPDFKIKDDPRITRVGRVLRNLSLDELPQLLNVLKGDMSLVGPRPTSFEASSYNPWQRERLNVRPGITGLVQVINRDGLEFEERVRYDVAYVRNRCFFLDLLILYRTFWALARGH